MANPTNRDLELNELGWMGSSSNVTWFGGNVYLIHSTQFHEYWFNRAGFLECVGSASEAGAVEAEFTERGLAPHFFVQEQCSEILESLVRRGYQKVDAMSVLTLEKPTFANNAEIRVVPVGQDGLDGWAKVYLLSFYGDLELESAVVKSLSPLAGKAGVDLLEAKIGDTTAGVVATFRSPGLLGVYALGTLPSMRNRGVAGTLLHEASRMADHEKRMVVLQTIVSDAVESFYLKGGFRRRYLKHLLKKGLDGSGKGGI